MNATPDQAADAFSVAQFIYEEGSFGVFLLVTVLLGGGAAWLSGRAIAQTWRAPWQVLVYSLILGCAVRFIHFSLFGGTLPSVHYYAVDCMVLIALGSLGFRTARVTQMVTHYRWLNRREGPFRWRKIAP